MPIVKSNPNVETVGIAPKAAWPTVALIALGVVLCVLDSIGVIDVPDEVWITLLGSGAGVGAIAANAPAALQRSRRAPRDRI